MIRRFKDYYKIIGIGVDKVTQVWF
jgi:hypothetical protein